MQTAYGKNGRIIAEKMQAKQNMIFITQHFLSFFHNFAYKTTMRFKKHVFICTNQRADLNKKSCGEACGLNLVGLFKKILKEKGLTQEIRAQRAGCLDACDFGPSVVVYPEGIYYKGVQPEDVMEIVEQHLIGGKPVERLVNNH